MNIGASYSARKYDYRVICSNDSLDFEIFPLLKDVEGRETMCLVSPEHGRSYIVSKIGGQRFVVSKGNGLSYTQHRFLNTGEMGCGTWGLLLKDDAVRDFKNGILASSYGIKTNRMHCVIELDEHVTIPAKPPTVINPVLLQYDVTCPYRISDAPFISRRIILGEVSKWKSKMGYDDAPKHIIAAETLISNLRIMHEHGFLHNAITVQNYTWALELLDFEMSSSAEYPYDESTEPETVFSLFDRETMYTYQIIIYIAKVLGEEVDFSLIDNMFSSNGMDIGSLGV